MFSAMLVTFREGLEAALIIAVIISLLDRIGAKNLARSVWAGAGAAIAVSLTGGIVLFALAGEAAEEAGEVFEVLVVLSAVFLLTYMILWMRKNGRESQARLLHRSSEAAKTASPFALGALAFAAVGREGLETVLFLLAGAGSEGSPGMVLGGLAGLSLAIGTGVIFYKGSLKINLSTLFKVTGVMLIVFSAGFLGHSLGELAELGWWPSFFEPTWDSSGFLADSGGLGAALKSVFGYDASPSIAQIAGYWSYLMIMMWLFLRPDRAVSPARQASKSTA
ncbi:MAG: FTR1 family protein [Thermoleophilia bacterium]|nr:FTR1 family protein [Thermoleophilia bacterium]